MILGNHPFRHQRGFTLIELLVCVAVVALLITMALPALSGARHNARRLVCACNERQLTVAWLTYATDYKCWPIPIDDVPYEKLRFGWGGVHWFGDNDTPAGLGVFTIPRDRPLNPYIAETLRIQTRVSTFRCPMDTGAYLAASHVRPWDAAGEQSLAPAADRGTCFAASGASYEANEWMYCRAGAVNGFGFAPVATPYPNFRWQQGPEHIAVGPNQFVLLGDIGAMTAGRVSEFSRQSRDEFCAWWHGYEKAQLGFADGSVRLERMGAVTKQTYTFYLDPSRQPVGSRLFACTW